MANKVVRIWNRKGNDYVDVLYIDNGDGTYSMAVVNGNENLFTGLTDTQLRASGVKTKSGSNYTADLPLTFKRTLVADTDVSIDCPIGTKFVYIYHALATPVHGVLNAAVTIPVAGAAGQHTCMFPPNSGVSYAITEDPFLVDTNDFHIRSASAGDVWITFTKES
jgi:hypothetical protein